MYPTVEKHKLFTVKLNKNIFLIPMGKGMTSKRIGSL